MKQPYLIQRCKVKNYSPVKGQMFSDCVSLDYMGSSEFEWGIIPQTMSAMFEKRNDLKVFKLNHKVELYFLCLAEQETAYHQVLSDLLAKKIRTKEYVFSSDTQVTLWMDLDNQVMFSTNKEILSKMHILLEGSQTKILHNRKIKQLCEEVAQKENLHDIHQVLPRTVALCGEDIEANEGTKALKGTTNYPVVFWLNGPNINGRWICGYYTVEQVKEFNSSKTGAIQNYIDQALSKKGNRCG